MELRIIIGVYADITTHGIEPSDLKRVLREYKFVVYENADGDGVRPFDVEFNRVLVERDFRSGTTNEIFQECHETILKELRKINENAVLKSQWIFSDDMDFEESFGWN